MSTIKSSDEHLTLNADGASKDIKFQANGVEKASISSSGAFTSTTIDATALTGTIPNFTSTGIDDNATSTSITINATENVGIEVIPESWEDNYPALQIGGQGSLGGHSGSEVYVNENVYRNGGNWKYINTGAASQYTGTGGQHKFKVAPSGSADSAISWTTAMTISNNGGIGINYTAPSGGQIYVNKKELVLNVTPSGTAIVMSPDSASAFEAIDFRNSSGSQIGSIACSTTATAYNTSSDYRLKENVDYTWDATTRLKQLKPARFNFIADDTNTLVDGFIAHEVSSVVPEAITGEKDAMTAEVFYVEGDELPECKSVGDVKTAAAIDPQGIDQSKLVPLLVKTIQELEARIAALES